MGKGLGVYSGPFEFNDDELIDLRGLFLPVYVLIPLKGFKSILGQISGVFRVFFVLMWMWGCGLRYSHVCVCTCAYVRVYAYVCMRVHMRDYYLLINS